MAVTTACETTRCLSENIFAVAGHTLALSQPSCRFRADRKLEDTYATAASSRKDGAWSVQTEPDSVPFQV